MIHKEIFNNEFLIRNATAADVIQMEFVQKQCYPSLDKSELLNRNHFMNHINIFPEGQFIVERDGEIVGSASTMRIFFPRENISFLATTDDLWTGCMDSIWGYFQNIEVWGFHESCI
jgi:hypothetical protein